jgi:lipid-A-disaccharide synthase
MKYYIIAGEASGDLHGSNLIKEIKKKDANANVRCWGGDMMEAAGAILVKHYRQLAFMGFVEVVTHLGTILNNLRFCKKDIAAFAPDVIVLVDYPGFNLRIATWAKPLGYKVVYYISPQVWAWKENRVKKIKQCVDKMLVILPFEKTFYKKWHYEVEYVGHPLVEVIDNFLAAGNAAPLSDKPVIALLPGSRKQEINIKLPVMLAVSKRFRNYQFIVAKAPGQEDAFYENFLQQYGNVSSTRNNTYTLLSQAKAALVTSGTATLETALFGVPQVVCYKGNAISYHIAKRLIKVPYISLVNLIAGKPLVKELIQHELTENNIEKELNLLLHNQQHLAALKKDYNQLKNTLSKGGHASANAAEIIVNFTAKGGEKK